MREKSFVHTAVLVGILSGQTKNGLNLINAPILAQETGINVKESHEESADVEAIVVQAEGHCIKGKTRGQNDERVSIRQYVVSENVQKSDKKENFRNYP